ncbi:MAG: Flp pilus assembly protein CpaB [Planctomycetota bacterium]
MKPQAILMLSVALCCGFIAMLGVRHALLNKGADKDPRVQVVAASVDVEAGVVLSEENVRLVEVPASLVPETAMRKLEDVYQRPMKSPISAGEWILASRVGERGERGAVANIPEGWAAVTIPVDATTTHSGMLQPGNQIDLLLTYRDQEGHADVQRTLAVLEFVEVFAVDARIYGTQSDGEEGQARNITLLVTPDQARAVTLAGNSGKLSTIMRKPSGKKERREATITQEFLNSRFGRGLEEAGTTSEDLKELPAESPVTQTEPTTLDAAKALQQQVTAIESQEESTEAVESGATVQEEEFPQNVWIMELHGGNRIRREKIRVNAGSDR